MRIARRKDSPEPAPRPKRQATNAHIFRYLQTGNPNKLEEQDLKRALEASLEERPDFWPEESASSCSSSEHSSNSNGVTTTSSSITGSGDATKSTKGRSKSKPSKSNHLIDQYFNNYNNNCRLRFYSRYKPVAKQKSLDNDFWHEGIMEWISWELDSKLAGRKMNRDPNRDKC